MGAQDALFDAAPFVIVPYVAPRDALSPDARRTVRQREAVARGYHPLLALRLGWNARTRIHPRASRYAAPADPRGLPFTCGSCAFRVLVLWHDDRHPKCVAGLRDGEPLDFSPRVSHSAATDVRAWWPACEDYEAGDQALSPDAARSIP